MKLATKLKKIQEEDQDSIRADVAETATKYGEEDKDIKTFFSDLLQHGCVSGIIPHLIYYTDTADYFRNHEGEIQDLKEETELNMGEPLKIGSPITNWLAWFGFEETARKMADELELEV